MTGYESKRAAARDKLDDDDALTIAYQSGYYDGKKAAQPMQEPFTYYDPVRDAIRPFRSEGDVPLYTTPPQRPWVGLTNEERSGIEDYCEMIIGKAAFDAIEAKLKEKNT